MSSGWAAVIVGFAALGWSFFLDIRFGSEARLARWWLSRVRAWDALAGPCSFVVSAGVLAGFGFFALVGHLLGLQHHEPRWALPVTLPALLAYAPFLLATAPGRFSGYREWRSTLAAAGATRVEQRRIAWWGGPPSLLGLVLAVLAVFDACGALR